MASARRIERFGLGQPVGVLQQQGQVAEGDCNIRMVRAEAFSVMAEHDANRARPQPAGSRPAAVQQTSYSGYIIRMLFAMALTRRDNVLLGYAQAFGVVARFM